MSYFKADDVTEYVRDNDVKFIRLQFCDLTGTLRNLSIMPSELGRAMRDGVSFDPRRVPSFTKLPGEELFLHPDPSTMVILPWRPQHGRVVRLFCDIRHADGSSYEGDSRYLCKKAAAALAEENLVCEIGTECTLYLFQLDEWGNPTLNPHDRADAFAIAPLDKGENVRREICLTLEEMGIEPRSSCHAQGPGQHEISLSASDAVSAADRHITFLSVARTIAARNGLHATLMPKPLEDVCGNHLRLRISLTQSMPGMSPQGDEMSGRMDGFTAGIACFVGETGAFLNPTANSYARLDSEIMPEITAGEGTHTLRLAADRNGARRIELAHPDPSLNPYLAFALLQAAGLRGIQENMRVAQGASLYQTLPMTHADAIARARMSALCRETLGEDCLKACLDRQKEWLARWEAAPEPKIDWEREQFFYRT